jgi:hypothetical protein
MHPHQLRHAFATSASRWVTGLQMLHRVLGADVEDGGARSTVEVLAEELAEPRLGDGDHDQDDARPGPAVSSTRRDATVRNAGASTTRIQALDGR